MSHTYLLKLLTYSKVQSPSWKANRFAASQEIPPISRNPIFITALTRVRHLSLSWANTIQSIYTHPTSWRSILILSTQLRLGLSSGLFPSGFPTKTLYTLLSSPIRATCPVHLILLFSLLSFTAVEMQAKSGHRDEAAKDVHCANLEMKRSRAKNASGLPSGPPQLLACFLHRITKLPQESCSQ